VVDAKAPAPAIAPARPHQLLVEAPTSEDDIARVAASLKDVAPLVFNWAEGGRTPPMTLERITELGFSLVLYPIGTLLAATAGIRSLLATLKAEGTPVSALPQLPSFEEFTDLIGLPEVQRLERRFSGS
jgi:2-methylisocitrate lyase-like PEP mutase family enzyme